MTLLTRFRFMSVLLVLAVVAALAPAGAFAQPGGVTLSVDRGAGATYAIGEPITITYQLPQPGIITITSTTATGTRTVVDRQYQPNTYGTVRSTVGDPPGPHTLRLELWSGPIRIATGETYFIATQGGSVWPPGSGGQTGAIGCNSSVTGNIGGYTPINRWTFSGSAGMRVSATAGVATIMIYPQPPTPTLQLTLEGPGGQQLNSGTNNLPETTLPASGQYAIVVAIVGSTPSPVTYSLNLNCAGGTGPQPPPPPPGAPTSVTYPAGWNLVGGPAGTVFPVTLHQWDPAAGTYRPVGAGTGVQTGQGYWAYFDTPATVNLSGAGQPSVSIPVPGGQWVQVANPSGFQNAVVVGADVVYTWDPAANQYAQNATLRPGQGAWAFRGAGGTISVNVQ